MRFLVFGLLCFTAVYLAESRSLVKRDVQDDIAKTIEELRDEVKKELDKLKAEGKTVLAAGLQEADKVLADLETQVSKLNPSSDVGKALLKTLEAALEKIKQDVENEIKKLNGGFYEDDAVEAQLVKEVSDLYDNAIKAIDTLAKSGKDKLVNGLEKAVAFVKSIATKVDALKPDTDYGKGVILVVDGLIKKGEELLENELKNAKAGVTSHGNSKDELIKEVKEVYEKAKAAFDALEKSDKKTLKEALTTVVAVGKQVQAEFKTLSPDTDVGKAVFGGVSKLIDEVVAFLELKLKSLGYYYADDAVEAQLVKEVSDLYDNAIKAIDTLAKSGKDKLVNGLEKAIAFVKSIATKVDALKPDTDYGKGVVEVVDKLIQEGEALLNKELKNAQAGVTSHGNSKDDLIKVVKEVYEKAKAAFDALEKSDKKTLKEALTTVVAVGKQVQSEFKSLHPDTDVGKAVFNGVSKLIDEVVAFLELKLKSIDSFYADDAIEAQLVKEVSDLYDNAIKAIDTLAKSGKDKLVNGLEKAVAFVKSIATKVDALKPDTDYGKGVILVVDGLIKKGEELLETELKNAKAGVTSHGNSKDELIKEVKEVYEKAKAAFDALEKSDKKTLKEALTTVVAVGKQVQAEFKTLSPDTDVGKAVFGGVSKLIDEVVAFLELKLKSLGFYYADDAVEAQLVKEVSDLYDNAIKAIDTLAKSGKDKLVNGLEKAIAFVKSIATKVDALKPDTDYGKGVVEVVDKLIQEGEALLNKELKNAQAGVTSHGDSKDELVKVVKEVYEKAKAAFDALEKSDKKTLKEALTTVVAVGKQVQTEFKSLHPDTDVGKAVFDGVSRLIDEVVAFLELKLKSLGF